MTPHDLIAAFEAVAEAPDGVVRLRELVLELAVCGRLVPQDLTDEPASVLLERIATEKARLAKAGKILTQEPAPAVAKADCPWRVPTGWVWTCTAALGVLSPRYEVADDRTVAFCPMPVIPTDFRDAIRPERRRWGDIKKGYTHFADGDVVVAKITPCFQNGKSCVMEGLHGIGAGTTELHVVRPIADAVSSKYLLLFYKSPRFIDGGVARMTGTAGQQRVPRDYFAYTPLPFPPLAEQHRIVARVDELMGLLDRLEAARTTRDATRAAVRDSSLDALREADTPDEVEVAWNRFAERVDELLCEPADIAPLRQAVLQLAVRGRLVLQDPADEPASVRLAGRMLSPSLEGAPFPLPGGWAWSSVSKLGRVLGGGTPSKDNSAFWDGDIPWVTPKDMKRDIIADSQDHITEAAVAGSSVKRVPPGALLMVVRGMILAHSFPTALTKTEVTVNQDMKALVPFDGTIGRFLLLVTKGLKPNVLSSVERSTHGTCKLPTGKLFRLPLPIAPWAEQRRIVARVDELMGLLDRLEERLAAARTVHAAFAAAAVHHLDA